MIAHRGQQQNAVMAVCCGVIVTSAWGKACLNELALPAFLVSRKATSFRIETADHLNLIRVAADEL